MDRIRADIHKRVTNAFEYAEDPPNHHETPLYVNVLPQEWLDEELRDFFQSKDATSAHTECSFNVTRVIGRCVTSVRDQIMRRIATELISCTYSLVRGVGELYPLKPGERCFNMYYLVMRTRPRLVEMHWDAATARLEYRLACNLTLYRIKEYL